MRYLVVMRDGSRERIDVVNDAVNAATVGCRHVVTWPWTMAQDKLRAQGCSITSGGGWDALACPK